MRTALEITWLPFLLSLLLLATPEHGWSMNLPLNKKLTVRLSTLSPAGVISEASSISATTDVNGKIGFSFPSVPASNVAPFLLLQIVDGTDVLRRAIVPAPLPGEHLDMGISETTDLQALALLKAVALSGRITPLHLLITQTIIRTPDIGATVAEAAAPAINAGAEAYSHALVTENLTADQSTTLFAGISRALATAAAKIRTSVDDTLTFDPDVEAYRRGEAYVLLLQGLIEAGRKADLAREPLAAAFAAAGGAAEDSLDNTPTISPVTRAVIRLGFVNDILLFSNTQTVRDLRLSLAQVGIERPHFDRIFFVIDLMDRQTLSIQMGMARDLSTYLTRGDIQVVRMQEYNVLAMQDLLLFKTQMDWAFLSNSTVTEYGDLMLELTNRMAAMGGVMSGMTPETLLAILGRHAVIPPVFKTIAAVTPVPTLIPLELAVWAYVHNEPGFRYTSVGSLPGQLTAPVTAPLFDRLADPYRSLAMLYYDLQMATALRWQDVQAADTYSTAHPLNPPGWYRLSDVYQIQELHRQRMAMIRQQVTGVTPATREAMIGLVSGSMYAF